MYSLNALWLSHVTQQRAGHQQVTRSPDTIPRRRILAHAILSCVYIYLLLLLIYATVKKTTVSAHTHTHFYNCVHMCVYVCISFEQGDGCGKPGANAGCEGHVSRPETTARGKHRQN